MYSEYDDDDDGDDEDDDDDFLPLVVVGFTRRGCCQLAGGASLVPIELAALSAPVLLLHLAIN